MWIADHWKDYAVLDCGGGEKIERWGNQILERPDRRLSGRAAKTAGWNKPNAIYRSNAGGSVESASCRAVGHPLRRFDVSSSNR